MKTTNQKLAELAKIGNIVIKETSYKFNLHEYLEDKYDAMGLEMENIYPKISFGVFIKHCYDFYVK